MQIGPWPHPNSAWELRFEDNVCGIMNPNSQVYSYRITYLAKVWWCKLHHFLHFPLEDQLSDTWSKCFEIKSCLFRKWKNIYIILWKGIPLTLEATAKVDYYDCHFAAYFNHNILLCWKLSQVSYEFHLLWCMLKQYGQPSLY